MLDLTIEKNFPLSSQEQYEIINKALDAANDNGFLNQFVFEHALWGFVAEKLIEDIDESIVNMLYSNPIQAWDEMLEEGIIEELFNRYNEQIGQQSLLNYFAQAAAQYYADYKEYLLSFGGALSQIDMLSSDNLNTFTNQLQEFMNSDNTLKTLELADNWGMNNKTESKEKIKLVEDELPQDSLFK